MSDLQRGLVVLAIAVAVLAAPVVANAAVVAAASDSIDASRTAPDEIAPGRTGTVTVDVELANATSRLSINETFSPAFASASLVSAKVNGNSVNPFTALFTDDGASVVFARSLEANDTVTVKYRVEISASASGGDTYAITGDVTTSATSTSLGRDSITVAETGQGNFQVTNFSAPQNASRNESITITAEVTNTGTAKGTQVVEWRLDNDTDGMLESGETRQTATLTLNASETETATFQFVVPGNFSLGPVDHGVFTANDSATASLNVTRDTSGGSGLLNATRSVPSSVGPGRSATVTLTLDIKRDADRISITESFSPAFETVSLATTTVNGRTVSPFFAPVQNDSLTVVLQNLAAGDTVRVTYEVTPPSGAASGDTFVIDGEVTLPSGPVPLDQDTIEIATGAASYAGNDRIVQTGELRTAIGDWVRGQISTSLLRTVIQAWVTGNPV